MISRLTILLPLLFLASCSEFCEQEVEDIAYIENQTGGTLNLEVCLDSEVGLRTIEIANNQDGRFSFGGREITYENNQLGAECNKEDGEEVVHSIRLTSTQFSSVKLCYPTESTSNTLIISSLSPCPNGTTEQETASTDCSSNDATGF